MAEEFKAERNGKKINVKPKIEKKGKDTIVKVPSFKAMNKAVEDMREKEKAERKQKQKQKK